MRVQRVEGGKKGETEEQGRKYGVSSGNIIQPHETMEHRCKPGHEANKTTTTYSGVYKPREP